MWPTMTGLTTEMAEWPSITKLCFLVAACWLVFLGAAYGAFGIAIMLDSWKIHATPMIFSGSAYAHSTMPSLRPDPLYQALSATTKIKKNDSAISKAGRNAN